MDNGDGKRPMDENQFPRMKIPNSNQVKKVRQLKNEDDPLDFSTGKALGGYMRPESHLLAGSSSSGKVHLSSDGSMQKKTNNMIIKDSSKQIDDSSKQIGDKERWSETCCGENFLSLMSLYEHTLRFHIGIEENPINLEVSLPGNWSVKAKRSERNSAAAKEVEEAALTIMYMYYYERMIYGKPDIFQSRSSSHPSISNLNRESFANPLLKWSSIDERERSRKGKALALAENKNSLRKRSSWLDLGLKDFQRKSPKFVGGDKESSLKGNASSSSSMKKRSPMKSSTTTEYNSSSYSPEENYTCNICYKAYTSFQASGGHRSSHNMPENLADINMVGSSKTTRKEAVSIRTDIPQQFTVCSNVFTTGQSLGGEKRCHMCFQYEQKIQDWSPSKKMKNVRVFDLNEPAVLEKEVDVDGAN